MRKSAVSKADHFINYSVEELVQEMSRFAVNNNILVTSASVYKHEDLWYGTVIYQA